VSSPSGVRGGAATDVAFSACFRPQYASGSKKNTILSPKLQSIRKNWYFLYESMQIPLSNSTYKVAPMDTVIHCGVVLCLSIMFVICGIFGTNKISGMTFFAEQNNAYAAA